MCPRSRNRRSALSEIKSWTHEPWKAKDAFNVLDKDGDGKISFSDLQDFFSVGKGLSTEEMEGMIAVADADNSGSVDFEEFRRILQLNMPEIQEIKETMPEIQEITETRSSSNDAQMWAFKEAFNVLDTDRDGIVSTEDLKTFFSSCTGSSSGSCTAMMSEKDLADMIEAAGGSVKCGVRYEDFARLMMTMTNGFS